MNAASDFGGCLWKDSCKQGTLINSAALEGGTGERRTFLSDGKSFSEARKLQRRVIFSASSMPVESATKLPLAFKDTLEKYNQTLQLKGGTFTYCPNRCPEAVAECHLKCHSSHR